MTTASTPLIFTTKGFLDPALLEKKTGLLDNAHERTTWVEYWLAGELVHRSVDIQLKEPVVIFGEAASIGG